MVDSRESLSAEADAAARVLCAVCVRRVATEPQQMCAACAEMHRHWASCLTPVTLSDGTVLMVHKITPRW